MIVGELRVNRFKVKKRAKRANLNTDDCAIFVGIDMATVSYAGHHLTMHAPLNYVFILQIQ